MFNIKIISILAIFAFLFVGCEDPTNPKESNSTTNESTLNDSDLGHEIGNIQDYFYDFDEDISSTFLFYSNTSKILSPESTMDPLEDTLNLRTFSDYLFSISRADFISQATRLPFDETDPDNWDINGDGLIAYLPLIFDLIGLTDRKSVV